MPFIHSAADALPFIDASVSTEALGSANVLIQAELASEDQTALHPSIPAQRKTNISDLVDVEHVRLAAGLSKETSIDMSRYEALDAPAKGDPAEWKAALQKAYRSAEYLHGREVNLGLLEAYGKNTWLIGNSQLEDVLSSLEKEFQATKLEQEAVEQARRAAQNSVAGEMQSLEQGWRTGVGRMIETQAAAERLKLEILRRKRIAAS